MRNQNQSAKATNVLKSSVFAVVILSLLCGACDVDSHADLSRDLPSETPLAEGLYSRVDIGNAKLNISNIIRLHSIGKYYYFSSPGGTNFPEEGKTVYGEFIKSPSNPDYWILECFNLSPEGKKSEDKTYWIAKIDTSNSSATILYIDYNRIPKEELELLYDKDYTWHLKNDNDTYSFLDYVINNNLVSNEIKMKISKIDNTPTPNIVDNGKKPSLHALVIGVSNYLDADLKLNYAGRDARDFARGLEKLKGNLYSDVNVTILVDGDATHDRILEQFDNLELRAASRDINMIFISGHGFADSRQNYWFLPVDATPETIRAKGISQDEIRRTLQDLAGKSLLFLDTCHAGRVASTEVALKGAVDISAVVKDFARVGSGVTTFASSTGPESSQESAAWGNGAFTKALKEGLFDGLADGEHTGTITPLRLEIYLEDRVKELTGGRQHPVMERPPGVPDFPIALSGH